MPYRSKPKSKNTRPDGGSKTGSGAGGVQARSWVRFSSSSNPHHPYNGRTVMVGEIEESNSRVRLLLDDGSAFLADIDDCVPSNQASMGATIVLA